MWNKISFPHFKSSQLCFNGVRWKLKKNGGGGGGDVLCPPAPKSKDINTDFKKYERIGQQLLYMTKGRSFFFFSLNPS